MIVNTDTKMTGQVYVLCTSPKWNA